MDILQAFYADQHTREAVKSFLLEQLDEIALDRIYKGENVSGIKDAKQTIEYAFIELGERYEPKKEKEILSSR